MKIYHAALLYSCLIGLVTLPLSTQANMTVYPMATGLNDKGEGSVRIISKSTDVQFVKATVFKINHPASPDEAEVAVSSGDAASLIVIPSRFVVPAGSSKLVRLVIMDPAQKETMYRVKFEGVSALDTDTVMPLDNKVDTHLSVNLVWGVLVSVPPAVPVVNLALSPDHGSLINNGNQRVKITGVGFCKKNDKDNQCIWNNENKNIFPQGRYSLPQNAGVSRIVIKYSNWINKSVGNIESFKIS